MTIALGRFTKEENYIIYVMDDWLRRNHFTFVGWSDLLLFSCAYFALGVWFTNTNFVTSWYTHGLTSSYLEEDESTKSKFTIFGSRFAEKSKSKNEVEFLNVKREKTKIKSKIDLIYNSKLKYDNIRREIRRKKMNFNLR